jgi:hypothetical protein
MTVNMQINRQSMVFAGSFNGKDLEIRAIFMFVLINIQFNKPAYKAVKAIFTYGTPLH